MTIVFPSLPLETLAVIFIAPWPGILGISVMMRLAPENWVFNVSENFSSIFAGAGPSDLSAGVDERRSGCAKTEVANKVAADARSSLEVILEIDIMIPLKALFKNVQR